MSLFLEIVWIIIAYLIGSVPVGVLLSRIKGKDPRMQGSGNIGATNVIRTVGKSIGIATLIGDALKGFLPVWFAIQFGWSDRMVAVVAFAAFFGHIFPIYLKLRGGKGVATSLGIFLGLNYIAVLLDMAVFIGILLGWRIVSVGSIVAVILMPIILFLLDTPVPYIAMAFGIAVFSCLKHKDNIKRLFAGTENKIGRSKLTP